MQFYFAPMEGVTGYIYRNAHNTFFHNIDKYFTPFIEPQQNGKYKTKQMKDILPENNRGLVVIPQILTNKAHHFINSSKEIKQLGYNEINLNLGCPSGTVVSKHKGSGFLSQREELERFLDEIFSASITKISVKTRIGIEQPDEFYKLIEIFNKFPMEELIIHPRLQKDYYKNKPNMVIFKEALALSKNPVCYNGDIFTADDYKKFLDEYSSVNTIMLGRGLIANPGLINEFSNNNVLDKQRLKDFHDLVCQDYQKVLSGDVNVLYKMKELWFYMIHMFTNHEKYAKKIKKSQRLGDYQEVVARLFSEQELIEGSGFLTLNK